VYRQVGNKNKAPLSKMKLKNKLATWAIIGKGMDPLFIPTDAFVCLACAGKVRKAQSVSNRSDPRPEPEPKPEPIIITEYSVEEKVCTCGTATLAQR
jgi:hypothetical protein